MKIILAGATGFIGGAVLSRLLQDERVAQVTCIARRTRAETSRRLVTTVHEDFAS